VKTPRNSTLSFFGPCCPRIQF